MTVPNFLVAGAARSGTTALIEGLRLHPDVFVTQPKEPHYFAFHGMDVAFTGPGDDRWVNDVAVTDEFRYLALFDDAGETAARGDGSVTTLYFAERAAPEIARINPHMRIVVLLREPVDRAFSSFAYLRLRGVEPEREFHRALDLEAERKSMGWHHMWQYAGMSRYAKDLRTLQETLGPDQVKVWFYDDLATRYEVVLDEVVAFLGLRPHPRRTPTMPRVNVSGTARSPLLQSLIGWATRTERVRSGVKRLVPLRMRERVRSSNVRPEMLSAHEVDQLTDLFADDLAQLYLLVADPKPEWLRRHQPSRATG